MGGKPIWSGWLLFGITRTNGRMLPEIQKCMPIAVGGGAEPCGPGEAQFVTLHLCPFEMRSPSSNRCFWYHLQILHRKSRGSGSSCSEHEHDGRSHTTVEPPREEWWKSTLQQSATAMPRASRSCGTLEDECTALVCKWFQRPVEIVGGVKDFSDMTVLQWWGRYHVRYPEVANLTRHRLCAQASSATSECAFSKVGLVLSKKRQRLTADHVDGISLLGWHYKDNGWGESSKRIRCVLQVEGQRHEEESEMVAL